MNWKWFVGTAFLVGFNCAIGIVYPNIERGLAFTAMILLAAWMIGELTE